MKKTILVSIIALLFFVACNNAVPPNDTAEEIASPNQDMTNRNDTIESNPEGNLNDLVNLENLDPSLPSPIQSKDLNETEERINKNLSDIENIPPNTSLETPTMPGINMDNIP